jgi:hypothetical protein
MPDNDEIRSELRSISGMLSDMLALMKKQQDQYEKDRLILSKIESTTTNIVGALHKLSDVLVNRKITVQARSP